MSDDNLSIMSSGNTTLMIDEEIQDETLKSFLQCNCKTCLEMYHNSTLSDNQSTHSKATLKSIQHHHHHHENEALHHHHHHDHEEYHLDDFSSHHFSHSYCHSHHHHHNSKNVVVVDDKSDLLSNLDALTVMSVHTTRSHPLFPSNIYDDCLSQVVDEDDDDEGRRSFHKLTNYKFNNNNTNFMDELEFNDDEKPSINIKSTITKEGSEFDSEKKLDEALETTIEDELMNVSDDKEAIDKETELIIDDNMLEDDFEVPTLQEETNLEFDDDLKSEYKEEVKCNELEFEDDDEQVTNKKDNIETLEFNEVETHFNDDDNISTITGVETIEIRKQQELYPHTELEFQSEHICSELDIDDVESVVKDDCKPIIEEQFNEIINNESDMREEEQSNVKSPIVDIDESEIECDEPENQTITDGYLIEEEKVVNKMEDDLELNDFSPELIEPIKECEEELITMMDNNLIEENIKVIMSLIMGFLDRRAFNKCKQLANNIQAVSRQLSINRGKYIQTINVVKALLKSSIVRKNLNQFKNSTETIASIGKGRSLRLDLKMSFERIETIQGLMRGVIYRKCQQNEKNNQMITDDFCHSPNTMFDNIPSPPVEKTETPKPHISKVKETNYNEDDRISFFPPPLPKPFRLGKQEKIKKPKKEEPKIEKQVELYNPKPIHNYGKISMIRHEIKRKNDEFYFDQAVEDTRVNEIEDENQMNEEQDEDQPIIIVQPKKKKMKMTKQPTHSTTPIFNRLDLTDEEIDELIIQKEKLCKIENDLAKLKEKEEELKEMNKSKIDKLHEYNKIKDLGQFLVEKLSTIENRTISQIYEEYSLNEND